MVPNCFRETGADPVMLVPLTYLGGLIALFPKFELSRNSYLRTSIQIKPSDLARFFLLES